MQLFLKKFSLALLVIMDIIAFCLAVILAIILRRQAIEIDYLLKHLAYLAILIPLFILILRFLDLYKIYYLRLNLNLFLATFNSIVYYFFFSILIFYLVPFFKIAPKTLLLLQTAVLWLLIYFNRILLLKLFRKFKVVQPIAALRDNYNILIKKIATELKLISPALKIYLLKPHDLDRISHFIEKKNIHYIIYSSPLSKQVQLAIENLALNHTITVQSASEFYELVFQKLEIEHTPPPIILRDLIQKKPFYNTIKATIDFIFGLAGLIVMIILYPLIFILIKLDDGGSVLYAQERIGYKGKIFRIYKFRTMIPNAQNFGPLITQENDRRITRLGKFLRKLHIDEIPQCLNLLKGELSLVGPRPEQQSIVKEYENKVMLYSLRHSVKPGIIGWAQINYHYARDLSDTIEKTKYDLYYIKNRSLLLDFEIVLKTLGAILKSYLA